MQSDDVFEDFASDDSFGSDDDAFSDEQIANVLDLMTEGSMARLNAVFLEDSSERVHGDHAVAAASSYGVKTEDEAGSGRATSQMQPVSPISTDKDAHESQDEQLPSPATSCEPLMLSLLEELFPSPRPSADVIGAPFSATVVDTPVDRIEEPEESQRISGKDEEDTHDEEDADRSDKQPEWMRALFDGMYAASTVAPRLTTISEVAMEDSFDESQTFFSSQHQSASAQASPEKQPSWMSLLGEIYPISMEPQLAKTSSSEESGRSTTPESSTLREDAQVGSNLVDQQVQEPAGKYLPQAIQPPLQLDTPQSPARYQYGASSISSSLDDNLSCSSLTWGKFTPDKMPVRHDAESLVLVATSSKLQTKTNKRLCYVPLLRSQKRRVRSRVITPAEAELTFRPKINTRFLKRLRSRRKTLGEAFSRRMEHDIHQRQERKLEREQAKKEKQKTDEGEQVKTRSLIAKGSARILQRNGLWEESLESRLKRLMRGQTEAKSQQKSSEKSRARRQKRKQRAEALASQACESLYQRGVEKKRRDQKRQQEIAKSLQRTSARPKMNLQSQLVMRKKLRDELELVCGSRRQCEQPLCVEEISQPKQITFVEFSCALLYFGLVPALETPWRGDEKVTLLWYAWRTFVKESEGAQDQEQAMPMSALESILSSVMLNGETAVGIQEQRENKKAKRELFQVLRLNYLSRKRSQTLEIQKMYSSSPKSAQHACSKVQGPPKQINSTRRLPKYNLHGKPVTVGKGGHDPLSQRQRITEAKVNQLRRQKEEQEVAECTFQPRITSSRSQSSEWSCDLRLLSVYGRQYKTASATKTAFDRLYSDAFQRQNNVLEKYFQAKLEEEEQVKKEAAISPTFVSGLTIDERLHNLQAALANNPLPVNYYKKIDAMRFATEMKVQESEAKAQRLLPVQFQKSEDGRTIVVPFQFATDMRASQLPARRGVLDKELKKKTRSLVHSAMNKLRETEIHPEVETDAIEHHEEQQVEGADFCLDVHLSPTQIRHLYFNVGDDPTEVSAAFAKRHGLHKEQEVCLIGVIEANLEKLLNLQF